MSTESGDASTTWRSAITSFDRERISTKGWSIEELLTWGNHADVAFLMLSGRRPTAAESKLFNAVLIASADHGPTSPSTLAARVIASGNRRALEAAIAGGILAIGDSHGGAGEEAMQMLHEGLERLAGGDRERVAADIVTAYVSSGRRLPGLGHRFHDKDPRTAVLWELSAKAGLPQAPIELMVAIEVELAARMGRLLPVNVDGAIAAVLASMGFGPAVGRIAFVLGRCAGIATHALEELTRERPMRIKFPYIYDGPRSVSAKP